MISDLEVLSEIYQCCYGNCAGGYNALRVPISDFADELKTPEFLYYVSTSMARKMFRAHMKGQESVPGCMYKVAVYLTKYVEITVPAGQV